MIKYFLEAGQMKVSQYVNLRKNNDNNNVYNI
jgi:hypothetical protein